MIQKSGKCDCIREYVSRMSAVYKVDCYAVYICIVKIMEFKLYWSKYYNSYALHSLILAHR